MKRLSSIAGLVAIACVLMAAAAGAKGLLIIQARPDQTTANTKLLSIRNAAGTEKVAADIEGDLTVHDLTATGTFTRETDNFANGLTVDTDKLVLASTGAIALDTNKFTVSAAGAGVFASTLQTTGNFSVGGAFGASKAEIAAASGNIQTDGTLTVDGTGTVTGNFKVGDSKFDVTAATGATQIDSTLNVDGAITGPSLVVSASSGSTNVTAAQSGAFIFNTGTSGTTTFVLPSAAAGLRYCFIEAGNAGGELLINPTAGDVISGKVTNDGAQMVTAAGSGIKNTAASNTVDDNICLVALNATTWYAYQISGTWAAQ